MNKFIFFGIVLSLTAGQALFAKNNVDSNLKSPKNIIVFIGDGCGENCWKAHDLNQNVTQRFDDSWVKLRVLTQSMTSLDKGVVFTEEKAYGDKSNKWRIKSPTDSAASGTALSTGTKTLNGYINLDKNKKPLVSMAEHAKKIGKSAGIITTVQISHATPATFGGAHNISRNNYKEIGTEMLKDSVLDLLIGAGHPNYNASGEECWGMNRSYDYVGGKEVWANLTQYHWTLLDQVDSFKSFPLTSKRILGIIPNRDALDPTINPPLSQLTVNAVDFLVKNPKGFFIMIEGGAIDRANHVNDKKQMLLEMKGFTDAINATCHKITEEKSGLTWDDTLVVITADHETGYIMFGKEGDLKSLRYNSFNHTNTPVPLFAKGANAAAFSSDSHYIDNTEIIRRISIQ